MQAKKGFALVISLIVILGSIIPVLAVDSVSVKTQEKVIQVVDTAEKDYVKEKEKEAKISKDQAIEIAKNALKTYFKYEMDEKNFEFRIEFREDYGERGAYAWSINWFKYDEKKNVNIDVWIDANNGKVKRIYKHEYNDDENSPTIAQITQDEAQSIADEFIKRVNPQEYKEVKLEENKYPRYKGNTDYNFTYIREVNGVTFDGNSITIGVDGIKSEVTSYSYSWDTDLQFPALDNIIDKEKAEQVIRANVDMTLNYIPNRNPYDYYDEKVKGIKLVYNPKYENGSMVDAKEGVMIDYNKKSPEEEKLQNITEEKKEEIFKKASIITTLDKEISQDRASEVIKKYIEELYGEGYEVDRLRYIENDDYWETNGKKAWSARFEKRDGINRFDDGNITIDALTEKLISAYKYNDPEEEMDENYTPVITWKKGYEKAIEAIGRYFPDKIKDIDTKAKYTKYTHYYNGKEMPETEYYFHFQRKVNGIYYSDDSISVNIDTKEGKIRELRCGWNDRAEFPKTTGVISKEDALEIFFEQYEPELVYAKINNNEDYKNPDWEIKLVYRRPFGYYGGNNIDAFTGKFLDYGGEEVSEKGDKFKETIKGHDAEKELSILASQGIIDTKEFELEKEVTRTQAIKMLVDAKGYRPYMVKNAEELKFSNITKEDEDYKYLQMAVMYGILENKEDKYNGDEKIKKEELAEMMVKLLGYDELAKIDDIFSVSYKDAKKISKDKMGYVAICKGLNIIKDDEGNFCPKDNVKIVDMATAIYNTLGNIRR